MLNTTGARLAAALLGYFALVIVFLTLQPFYVEIPDRLRISLRVAPDDILENIILFLPIGFLYRVTGGGRRGALLLGAALSAAVEIGQLFIPVRTASPSDLVTNTTGAWIGAWLHDLLKERIAITPARVGRLALEIPLMGLIYMLVPLLWMNALALNVDANRWLLTMLIGACGAIILSDIHREWWGAVRLQAAGRMGLLAGAWFLLGSAPGIPRVLPTVPLAIALAALATTMAMLPWRSKDRRFERTTLSRILPIVALYLLLAATWPPLRPLTSWHGTIGLTDRIEPMSTRYPAPLLEYLAAFTVLGYIIAEWRGRAELPLARDLPRLLLIALGCAIILETLVGFQTGNGASVVRLALVVAGAVFGGVIYHLQRAHVRFLLKR